MIGSFFVIFFYCFREKSNYFHYFNVSLVCF